MACYKMNLLNISPNMSILEIWFCVYYTLLKIDAEWDPTYSLPFLRLGYLLNEIFHMLQPLKLNKVS